jgi:hypothetical protein
MEVSMDGLRHNLADAYAKTVSGYREAMRTTDTTTPSPASRKASTICAR